MGTIVDDIMTKSPITIREDESLRTAVTLMDTNRIKRLIVTDDDGKVRGVVSRGRPDPALRDEVAPRGLREHHERRRRGAPRPSRRSP